MHQILLMTALTATSGLFGGGRQQCASGNCGYVQAPAQVRYAAPAACAGGSCGTYAAAAPAPRYYYPTAAAPQVAAPRAPQPAYVAQPAAAPRYVNSYYYPPATTCTSGNCPRY